MWTTSPSASTACCIPSPTCTWSTTRWRPSWTRRAAPRDTTTWPTSAPRHPPRTWPRSTPTELPWFLHFLSFCGRDLLRSPNTVMRQRLYCLSMAWAVLLMLNWGVFYEVDLREAQGIACGSKGMEKRCT